MKISYHSFPYADRERAAAFVRFANSLLFVDAKCREVSHVINSLKIPHTRHSYILFCCSIRLYSDYFKRNLLRP